MGIFNPNDKSINLKIVYYGPSFGGKTTSLQRVYEMLNPKGGPGLISLDTDEDATLFFDYLPINLMILDRYAVRIQGFTVPGQSKYAATRRLVLKGADGVVFVADAQRDRLRDNLLSFAELCANLQEHSLSVDTLPLVLEYNKCDLEDRLPLRELQAALNQEGKFPAFETIATQSKGVFETFAEVVRRLVARTHQDFDLDRYGIKRNQLASALDQALAEIRGPATVTETVQPVVDASPSAPIKVRGESPPGDLINGTDSCPLDPVQLQEQLLKSAVETNLEFARLFAEQAEYRRGLEQRHSTLLETAQMASHDLRKPVAALKNILHILKKEGAPHLKKNLREALGVAIEVTEYMERLIHELLEERMQYFEKPTMQDAIADLAVLMDDVQARLRFLASEKRALIRCRPLPRMRCDPTSMTSVFMNVIGNAIKYADARKPAPSVEVGARVYRKSLLLYIQDNGIGIARSELPRILRKYARGSNASSVAGTGLGLHIVREIVTDHGGRIRVTSKLGEGTTVLMRFPAERLLDEDRLPDTAMSSQPMER